MGARDETEMMVLSLSPEVTIEQIAAALNRVEALKDFVRELDGHLKDAMKQWIEANGQDIEIGTKRWYLAPEKKVKERDPAQTCQTLLEVTGGDFGRMGECLSANAFKPGAIRKLLAELGQGEKFAELFDVQIGTKLAEGKPVKQLQVVDTRFIKSA